MKNLGILAKDGREKIEKSINKKPPNFNRKWKKKIKKLMICSTSQFLGIR